MVKYFGFVLILFVTIVASGAKSIKAQDIEPIGGFIFYRVVDEKLEYLLLKKAKEDDWSPPKGNLEGNESEIDTAIRETKEETGWDIVADYDAHIQYKVYFEYETSGKVLKKVHLWPARLSNFDKPIELSPEHSEYAWLEYDDAVKTIKKQYKDGFTQAHAIIRVHERIP